MKLMQPGVYCSSIADIIKKQTTVIADFPHPPVAFIDVTSIWRNPQINTLACQALNDLYERHDYDAIVALEARAWPFAQQMSLTLNKPWYPVRKPGKLPGKIVHQSYDCEYATGGMLELQSNVIPPDSQVIIVDDLIATGGTAIATKQLVQQVGAEVVGVATIYGLDYLLTPQVIAELGEVRCVVHYVSEPEPYTPPSVKR